MALCMVLVSNLKCKVESRGSPTPSHNFFGQKAIEILGDTFHKLFTSTTELWLKLVGLLIINIIGNAWNDWCGKSRQSDKNQHRSTFSYCNMEFYRNIYDTRPIFVLNNYKQTHEIEKIGLVTQNMQLRHFNLRNVSNLTIYSHFRVLITY